MFTHFYFVETLLVGRVPRHGGCPEIRFPICFTTRDFRALRPRQQLNRISRDASESRRHKPTRAGRIFPTRYQLQDRGGDLQQALQPAGKSRENRVYGLFTDRRTGQLEESPG